ncbi:MAG: hypothetical protein IKD46_00415 [Lentisphaeria bacterium]|nr:hypothetical protein [Lentisphaeria bacterium]
MTESGLFYLMLLKNSGTEKMKNNLFTADIIIMKAIAIIISNGLRRHAWIG